MPGRVANLSIGKRDLAQRAVREELERASEMLREEAETCGIRMRDMKAAYEKEAFAESSRMRSEMEETRRKHERQISELRENCERQLSDLKSKMVDSDNKSNQEIDRLRTELRSSQEECILAKRSLEESKRELATVRNLNETLETRNKNERDKHHEELTELKRQCHSQIESAREDAEEEFEDRLKAERARIEAEVTERIKNERGRLENEFKFERTKLDGEFEERIHRERATWLEQEKAAHQKELEDIASEHERAMAALKSDHSNTVTLLAQEHEATLKSVHAATELSLKTIRQEMEQLQHQHQTAMAALQDAHESALNALKTEHEAAADLLKTDQGGPLDAARREGLELQSMLERTQRELEEVRGELARKTEDAKMIGRQFLQAVNANNKNTKRLITPLRFALLAGSLLSSIALMMLWKPKLHYSPFQEITVVARDLLMHLLGVSSPSSPLS